MISYLKGRLLSNVLSLFGLHFINFILTMAAIPYLTRVLGPTVWGQAALVQIFINYIIWFTNWSFYYSSTKRISACDGVIDDIQKIFSQTIATQWMLCLVSLLIAGITTIYIDHVKYSFDLFLFALISIIGNSLQPYWLLNGLEKMRESALFQLLAKFISLALTLVFVSGPDDLNIYFLLNGLVSVVVGLLVLLVLNRIYNIKIQLIGFSEIIIELKYGLHLFLSGLWGNIQATLIPIAIGMLSGPTELGLYSLAERIKSGAIQLLHPITHALFPRLCNLFANNLSAAYKLFVTFGVIVFMTSLSLSFLVLLYSDFLVSMIGGSDFKDSSSILKVLASCIFITSVNEYLIYQYLIPTGKNSIVNFSKIISLLIICILGYSVIQEFKSVGAAALCVFVEIITLLIIASGKNFLSVMLKGGAYDNDRIL